jgi:predicted phage baseplate assembly protein
MSLPAPNLDDRRFQELVDEAKRMVQKRWPEWTGWTDHNVSDPGVTLIETFAYMVDQLLYRLNRMPDRTYVKLLDLIGLHLHPPTGAVAPVTFWLSAPQRTTTTVPEGTEVATERTTRAGGGAGSGAGGGPGAGPGGNGQNTSMESVVFRTMTDLDIVSCRLVAAGSAPAAGGFTDLTDVLAAGREVALFSGRPQPGDAFYVGLSAAAPSCVVAVRVFGQVQGYGINPDRPPRVWQAWDGRAWVDCEIERDETGGFNRAGVVVLHLPATHVPSVVANRSAGWLRCVVTPPPAGESAYEASPRVQRADAFTVGGTVDAIHSLQIDGEVIGTSEGVPGQERYLQHRPVVLAPDPEVIDEIHPGDGGPGTRAWVRVDSFADFGPGDRVFTLDPASGTVRFPPAVRQPDGSVRHFGEVPGSGTILRMRAYRTGGGRIGNVAAHAIRHLRAAIPSINSVDNRRPATGGVDGESLEEAKARGPLLLRTRDRAVTASDYEHLTREAAPEVARVMCPDVSASEPGTVRVLVVPDVRDDGPGAGAGGAGAGLRLDQLRPSAETLARISEYLEERRVVGVRVVVERPSYQGLTVVARLRARRNANAEEVRDRALAALNRYYHPVLGGPEGTGWPFGRPAQAGEVHAVLQRVPGVDFVEESLLFAYDVESGRRDETERERIDLAPTALVFSFGHDVLVEAAR